MDREASVKNVLIPFAVRNAEHFIQDAAGKLVSHSTEVQQIDAAHPIIARPNGANLLQTNSLAAMIILNERSFGEIQKFRSFMNKVENKMVKRAEERKVSELAVVPAMADYDLISISNEAINGSDASNNQSIDWFALLGFSKGSDNQAPRMAQDS